MNADLKGNAGACGGVVVVTDTTPITGNFHAIQVLETANFSTFTETEDTGSMTGFDIPAGTILYNGLGITAFTLTSGKVRAYKSVRTA